MMLFDWFVLPFTGGLIFLLGKLIYTYSRWIMALPSEDLTKIRRKIFTSRSLQAIREVFTECLLHRKIFRINPLLGYMHASLAFGWFLLIVGGNWEARIFYHEHISPPYVPIFFRFFNPHPVALRSEQFFSLLMDIVLLVVLSGVALAWIKRLRSKYFGMKKTTILKMGDKIALYTLWFIFPLRFFAESFTSANTGGGHFLTKNAGDFFGSFLPTQILAYPAWWAYSLALGIFFVSLPYSRYMHIPTEILLIFLRKYGITESSCHNSYTMVQVQSCSRCGICIDPCQLISKNKSNNKIQSVYQIQSIRYNTDCEESAMSCMMCGRCDSVCPVGIDIKSIRIQNRSKYSKSKKDTFTYINKIPSPKVDVIYFAGCMGQLQPSVVKAMTSILSEASIDYWFMDEAGSICCGRPLLLAGKYDQAMQLMARNKTMIENSEAKTIVTSCPICYKMFRESYQLGCEVLHHSEYLLRLIKDGKLELNPQSVQAIYHDPCELGRGSEIYDQPRDVLNNVVTLHSQPFEKKKALCCGGSLASINLNNETRRSVTVEAINMLMSTKPELIITGCPLCKKTFSQAAPVSVLDIAEVVFKSIRTRTVNYYKTKQSSTPLQNLSQF